MSWSNYHNHCHYCDGEGSVVKHVESAIANNVASLGFSCHCPVPFENKWSMPEDQVDRYLREIEQSQQEYSGSIGIYKGLEVDYIPEIISPADAWIRDLHLDYTIGSIHFVGAFENGRPWEVDGKHEVFCKGLAEIYAGDVHSVIQRYFELTRQMVREACPDIVGHFDKIKMQNQGLWDEQSHWYRKEVFDTLEEIKGAGAVIEVNTRGIYKKLVNETYPSRWILKEVLDMGIPIQVNSDAHTPTEIIHEFAETYEDIYSIGFRKSMVFFNGSWELVDINQYGLVVTDATFSR